MSPSCRIGFSISGYSRTVYLKKKGGSVSVYVEEKVGQVLLKIQNLAHDEVKVVEDGTSSPRLLSKLTSTEKLRSVNIENKVLSLGNGEPSWVGEVEVHPITGIVIGIVGDQDD